jgi:hypothetical protein
MIVRDVTRGRSRRILSSTALSSRWVEARVSPTNSIAAAPPAEGPPTNEFDGATLASCARPG